jgi:hypothetical protein
LLALALALAVATALATLAIFAAEARAGSFGSKPPKAVLMKGSHVLQVRSFSGGTWSYYQNGWICCFVADNFGHYAFPKADVVGAGTRLHVRLAKPERPSVGIVARPKSNEQDVPYGQRQQLEHTFRRVERDGEKVAWDVFFRVNEPDRHYYLVVYAEWEKVPGTHTSYGDANYGLHVKTR